MNIVNAVKSFFRLDEGERSFTTWDDEYRNTRDRYELLEEYKNIVYSCITTIAEDVGKYQPVIKIKDTKGRVEQTTDHPFIDLLENPNPEMSQFELFEATQSYLELTGEAFWFLARGEQTGEPKEIYVMRPDRVQVAVGKNKTEGRTKIVGFVYCYDETTKIPLEVEEVLFFKNFHPKSPYRGKGPVESGILYIDTETQTSRFQFNFLRNQAMPAGVISLKGGKVVISSEAFRKIKKEWKENYGGSTNAGKTLFVREAEASFQRIGLAINELGLPDLTKINDEKIRRIFRVPRELLGDALPSGLGRAGIESIEYIFAKRTIEPKLNRIDDKLTMMLKKYWPRTERMYVDHISLIPADKEAILNEDDRGTDRWITRNEVRKNRGLPPIKGGDTLYADFNKVPIEQLESMPVQEQVNNSVRTATVSQPSHNHTHETVVDKGQDQFFNTLDKIEVSSARGFSKGLKSLLEEQQKEVINIIEDEVSKGILAKGVDYNGVLFTLVFNKEDLELSLLPSLYKAFVNTGKATLDSLGLPDEEFVLTQARRNAIFSSTDRLMKSFNEETSLKIQQQIAQWSNTDESKEQLVKRIEEIYTETKGYRARRIGDTESHKAVNAATAEVYKEQGYKKLRWKANPSACEFCKAMDGTTVTIGQPFLPKGGTVTGEDGGEYVNDYVDVEYADLHPFCTCRLVPVK